MPPSISDVARAAGLSKATISRVLSGNAPVSEESRERALRAIADLNYQPNRHAQGLRRHREAPESGLIHNTFMVAVLNGGDSGESFFRNNGATYDGILEAAHERGIHLMLKLIPIEECGMPIAPPCLSGLEYDAILAAPSPIVEGTAIERAGRTVWFGARPHGVEDPTVVEPDSAKGIGALLRHLVDLGHRRIAAVCDNLAHFPYRDRLDSFQAAAATLGVEVWGRAELRERARMAEFVDRVRRDPRRPTAVMVASDGLGARLVTAFGEAGLNVPGDISVTGFDGRDKSRWCTPGLTTWEVDWHALGRNAVHQAILLAERQRSVRVLIGGRILEQGSTARPPAA